MGMPARTTSYADGYPNSYADGYPNTRSVDADICMYSIDCWDWNPIIDRIPKPNMSSISLEEVRTSGIVAQRLRALGLEMQTEVAVAG
jgi:hypothetical protein